MFIHDYIIHRYRDQFTHGLYLLQLLPLFILVNEPIKQVQR